MTNKEKLQDIYNMLGQGQLLEAFDKYYHQDVIMEEPRGTRNGKADCRSYEEQFLSSIQEFHHMEVTAIGADDANGKTFIEVMMDITFKDGNRAKFEQVGVQKWEGDQIVHERFYYDNSPA